MATKSQKHAETIPSLKDLRSLHEQAGDALDWGEVSDLFEHADSLLAACKAVLRRKGTNVMGEPLCPVCSYPEKHARGCPIPQMLAAVAKAEGKQL